MPTVRTLEAEARPRIGTPASREQRRQNRIPAVVYGGDAAAVHISLSGQKLLGELDQNDFLTQIYEIHLDGATIRALPRAVQRDPVTSRAIHIDFQRVTGKTLVRVSVPVRFLNDDVCPGIKQGGVLNTVRHEIEVQCSADNIPSEIIVDLATAQVNDSIHIESVVLPEGVKSVIERNFTIATIAVPSAMRSEAQGAEAAEAEAEKEAEASGTEDKADDKDA